MTVSDPPILGLLVLAALLVPVGGGLVGLAWFAWARDLRWPSLALAAVCAIGVAVAGTQGRQGVTDLAWVALAFSVALVAAAFAWAVPSRATRVASMIAAAAPALTLAWFVLTDLA